MIDLIIQGTKANIAALLRGRGLIDADNEPVPGCELAWWAGGGKFVTTAPVLDAQGNVTTPAVFMAGFVVMCRLHSSLFTNDRIDGAAGEQWARSKVAKWIKDNGTLGSIEGIPTYLVNNVRLFRAADVQAWLDARGLPGHEWFGGNSM